MGTEAETQGRLWGWAKTGLFLLSFLTRSNILGATDSISPICQVGFLDFNTTARVLLPSFLPSSPPSPDSSPADCRQLSCQSLLDRNGLDGQTKICQVLWWRGAVFSPLPVRGSKSFWPGVGGAILDMPHLSVFPMVLKSSAEELTRFVQRQVVLCEYFVRVMFDYSQV